MATHFILTLSCRDQIGIVSRVSTYLLEHQCNIAESKQYWEQESNHFFMRVDFILPLNETLETLSKNFIPIAEEFGMNWQLKPSDEKVKTLILVSKFDHCLNDLLYRTRTKALNIDIVGVISNHEESRKIVQERGYDFYYLPVEKDKKLEQEAKIWDIFQKTGSELVILARYMQILSDDLCQKLSEQAINIHHSFLPGFKGANPYSRAFKRGVKLIGATAHYVTADLDEGPIIEQDVQRVDHNDNVEDLILKGRDVECQTLARAVKYHSEHRVLIHHGRTVVFR